MAEQELQQQEQAWLAAYDPAALNNMLPHVLSDRKIRLFAVACVRRIAHLLKDPASTAAIHAAEAYADDLIPYAKLKEAGQTARGVSAAAVRRAHSVWAQGPAAPTARAAWVAVWASSAAENCCDEICSSAETGSLEAGFQAHLGLRTAQVASWARSVNDELSGTGTPEEETATDTSLFFSFLRGLKQTVQRIEQAVRDGDMQNETVLQSFLFRDIVGNPFRTTPFHPDWRAEAVVNMASEAYASPSPGQLAIIADALEHETECKDPRILRHLRGTEHAMRILRLSGCTDEGLIAAVDKSNGPHDLTVVLKQFAENANTAEDRERIFAMIPILTQAVHVRGCWVLDQILEKE